MNKVFVHTGLPKCASKTLQYDVFPYLDVYYYHKPDFAMIDFSLKDKPILISNECYSVCLCRRTNNKTVMYRHRFFNNFSNFGKIKDKNVRFILVLRNKEQWIKSAVIEYKKNNILHNEYSLIKSLKDIYDFYLSFIYNKDVLVLWLEDFKNREFICKQLSGFLGLNYKYIHYGCRNRTLKK